MLVAETLHELEALGSAGTEAIYRRHGVVGPCYGVLHGRIDVLAKRLRKSAREAGTLPDALADSLWASGVYEARVLATLLSDPKRADAAHLDAWAAALDSYPLADAFAGWAAKAPDAEAVSARWRASGDEWVVRAGWAVLAWWASKDPAREDAFFAPFVPQIEAGIHAAPNRAREAMNAALIAIGGRSDTLAGHVLAAAGRLGTVHVDHGATACETPDAAASVRAIRERAG